MSSVIKSETKVMGKDVWWDTELQRYRKKRLNLEKVPLKFRCPRCGKIVVKPRDRDSMFLNFILRLKLFGGVCRTCFLDGHGINGAMGKYLGDRVKERKRKSKLFEMKQIAKYGKEPKYWLDSGFTKNPAWLVWWERKLEIKDDEKRRKNAKLVLSEYTLIENVHKDGGQEDE